MALRLHISFCLHLQESSENALWIVSALKSATFKAPKIGPETALKTTSFMLFLKKLNLKLSGKAGDHVCFDGLDQFYKYFFFLHTASFVIGGNCLLFMKPHHYLFPRNTSDYLYLLKVIIRIVSFSNIFRKP